MIYIHFCMTCVVYKCLTKSGKPVFILIIKLFSFRNLLIHHNKSLIGLSCPTKNHENQIRLNPNMASGLVSLPHFCPHLVTIHFFI